MIALYNYMSSQPIITGKGCLVYIDTVFICWKGTRGGPPLELVAVSLIMIDIHVCERGGFMHIAPETPQNEMVLHRIRKRFQQQLPHAEKTTVSRYIVFDVLTSESAWECEPRQRVMQQESGSHTLSCLHDIGDIDGFVASSGGPSIATVLTLTLRWKDTLQINTKEVPNDLIERFLDLKRKPQSIWPCTSSLRSGLFGVGCRALFGWRQFPSTKWQRR